MSTPDFQKLYEGLISSSVRATKQNIQLAHDKDALVVALREIQTLCIDEETAPSGCAPLRTQVYERAMEVFEEIAQEDKTDG